MTVNEKIRALMEFYGITRAEARAMLVDMGEIDD